MKKTHLKYAGFLYCGICLIICMVSVQGSTITVPSRNARTISKAMIMARSGDTVLVSKGIYRERIMVSHGVVLKSSVRHAAVIDGRGRGTAVTMGKNTVINGFIIRNGTIGVYSENEGNEIRNCMVIRNWQAGVVCVKIVPLIEDNVVAFNKGAGMYLIHVIGEAGKINHNTVIKNLNHGILLTKSNKLTIENNIIAFNKRYGIKPDQSITGMNIANNDFYSNHLVNSLIPDGNFSFEPIFVNWREMNFVLDPGHNFKQKGSDELNVGIRLTDHE